MDGQELLKQDIANQDKNISEKKKEINKLRHELADLRIGKARLEKALDLWQGKKIIKQKWQLCVFF